MEASSGSSLLVMEITLSLEQQRFVDEIGTGRNVFASGPAGTGKSEVLNWLRKLYEGRLSVTATTGVAALNVKGTTLHSFAGLGLGQETAEVIAQKIVEKKGRAYKNIKACSRLAIDEVSMMSAELMDKLDAVFRAVRKTPKPFGGIQLILFGDFYQLPPVTDGSAEPRYAFESAAWSSARISTTLFTQSFRQADRAFAEALGRLRTGNFGHPSVELIRKRINIPFPDDGLRAVVIETHNETAERTNIEELDKIREPESKFVAHDTGEPPGIKQLDKECLAPATLRLKKGAQVMLLKNLSLGKGLVNGSQGIVLGINDGEIHVRFGKSHVEKMSRSTWEIRNGEKVIAERSQFPLRLAYALTCHKVQGMTLDRIECRITKTFAPGQAYVAISRVKTLEGLFITGNATRAKFTPHPKVVAFYEEVKQGSKVEVLHDERPLGASTFGDPDLRLRVPTSGPLPHVFPPALKQDRELQGEGAITLTRENIKALTNGGAGALTNAQCILLFGKSPAPKGWLTDLVGTKISLARYKEIKDAGGIRAATKKTQRPPLTQSVQPISNGNLIRLTEEHLKELSPYADIQLKQAQYELLGEWPLVKGWKKRLIGREITRTFYSQVKAARLH